MALSRRVATILSRLPRHWEADGQGKLFERVVSAFAQELEIKSAQSARVRHAHRLAFAEEVRDLMLLAGLRGFAFSHVALLAQRLEALRAMASVLRAEASDASTLEAVRRDLAALLSIAPADLAPVEDDPDPGAGYHRRLAAAVAQLAGLPSELDAMRWQIRQLIDAHRQGNGTVAALLSATATCLGLDRGPITSSDDGYWHFSLCAERVGMALAGDEPAGLPSYTYPTQPDYLGLEENPYKLSSAAPIERYHGELFTVDRNGFDEVPVSVHVIGRGDGTVRPMVVNIQSGDGVWFNDRVPDGQELVFAVGAGVTLDGVDVTRYAYSFHGGVFADAGARDEAHDFVFGDATQPDDQQADRAATFAVTQPIPDGFATDAVLPHGDGLLQNPTLSVGTTRWRYFVQVAHFGTRQVDPEVAVPAVAVHNAALFSHSVYQGVPTAAGEVGFSWNERQAFVVNVWIPERFAALDTGAQPTVAEQVGALLERYRAAGIQVNVHYASDQWTLPDGVLRDADSDEALGVGLHVTRL